MFGFVWSPNRVMALFLAFLVSLILWYQAIMINNDDFGKFEIWPSSVTNKQIGGILFFTLASILYWLKLVTVFGPQ
jgi:hypothetical protein